MQAINIATPHSQAERTEIGFAVICLSEYYIKKKKWSKYYSVANIRAKRAESQGIGIYSIIRISRKVQNNKNIKKITAWL
jgi:hypothetical protein